MKGAPVAPPANLPAAAAKQLPPLESPSDVESSEPEKRTKKKKKTYYIKKRQRLATTSDEED